MAYTTTVPGMSNAASDDRQIPHDAIFCPRNLQLAVGPWILDSETLLYDLRDPRHALAFATWRESDPQLLKSTRTLRIRHWMLWPRLKSLNWVHSSGETVFRASHTTPEIETLPLDDGRPRTSCDHDRGSLEMCACSVRDLLHGNSEDTRSADELDDSVFIVAEPFVRMLQEHSRYIVQQADLQRFVKTSGRFKNVCQACQRSTKFLCDHSIVDLGQDRRNSLAREDVLWSHNAVPNATAMNDGRPSGGQPSRHARVDSKQGVCVPDKEGADGDSHKACDLEEDVISMANALYWPARDTTGPSSTSAVDSAPARRRELTQIVRPVSLYDPYNYQRECGG